jgi:hypothetical protein
MDNKPIPDPIDRQNGNGLKFASRAINIQNYAQTIGFQLSTVFVSIQNVFV